MITQEGRRKLTKYFQAQLLLSALNPKGFNPDLGQKSLFPRSGEWWPRWCCLQASFWGKLYPHFTDTDNLKSQVFLKTPCLDHGNAELRTNEAWTQLQWADTRLHGGCWDMRMSWTRQPLKVPSHLNHFDSTTYKHLLPASLQHAASTCMCRCSCRHLFAAWLDFVMTVESSYSPKPWWRQQEACKVCYSGISGQLNFNIQKDL